MAKKATFRRVEPAEQWGTAAVVEEGGLPGMDDVDTVDEVDGVDEVDTVDEVDEVDEVDTVDEVDGGLEAQPTELTPLEGSVPEMDLGPGPITCTPIYLKRPWARGVCNVGDCIGCITTREGVDVNLLIDAIRNQVAGEARPE